MDHGETTKGKARVGIERGQGDHPQQQGFGLVQVAAMDRRHPGRGIDEKGIGVRPGRRPDHRHAAGIVASGL